MSDIRSKNEDVPMFFRSIEDQLKKEKKETSVVDLNKIGFGNMFAQKPDNKKFKFMLVSTHMHQFTGYSKVSHGVINELKNLDWLQVYHFGFQKMPEVPQGFRPYPSNVEVFDAAGSEKPLQ